jgi:cytochrome c biogenesis protein
MKFLFLKRGFNLLSNIKFSIFLLLLIALSISIGSFIEQDQSSSFYQENYIKPIFGFVNWSFIITFGFDHIYTTPWFLFLLILFAITLSSCTFTRQFPLFVSSKEFFFKTKKNSFLRLSFSFQIQKLYSIPEWILLKLQTFQFFLFQKRNLVYGYKGLIGRISPMFVHFSLLLILLGAGLGTCFNFKLQQSFPKGETSHLQNPMSIGVFSFLPQINIRVNDFWVEYEKNQIHQFYSNISILDNFGKEKKEQTLSVNHPLNYKNIDFYQSDWNIIGIRILNKESTKIYELPVFPLDFLKKKSGITWIKEGNQIKTILIDQFQNIALLFDQNGILIGEKNIGDDLGLESKYRLIEILSSTGFFIKYDPSLGIISLGFGFLMITTILSFLPYTQIWICHQKNYCSLGSLTNRGKIQLEMELERLRRFIQFQIIKSAFIKKN